MGKHFKPEKRIGCFGLLLRLIGVLLLIVLVVAGGGIGYLTATEFNPEAKAAADIAGEGSKDLAAKDTLKIVTWNVGYGALGDNADFFMDGGKMVNTADKDRVASNLDSITARIAEMDPDIIYVQEIDRDSARSHHVNEYQQFNETFTQYNSSFANNYKVAFVPFPVPPLGKVDSGVATFSKFQATSAERIQLPVPFEWPVRVANLKRCLLVSRIPVADSDKELVLVNLHLEAYDSGEGKIAQTKMLAQIMQDEAAKGNYVIAGGDFNQIFSSADQNAYPAQEGKWAPGQLDESAFEGEWQFLMDASTPTCRSLDQPLAGADTENFQYYLIDGFIVSNNLKVKSLKTIDAGFTATDHNPVALEVTLK